jgi:hypothetical protein
MKRVLILFLFFVLLIASGCRSKERLNEETFVNVYTDLVIAEDTAAAGKDFKKLVFNKYNITEQTYNNTVAYYNDKPEKWEKFFQNVEKKVNDMGKKPLKK